MESLTNKEYWEGYWKQKKINTVVKKDFFLHSHFDKIVANGKIETALEIGGFPGYYSIYLNKYHNIEAYLLDYYIDNSKLIELEINNGLPKGTIKAIKSDLFNFKPTNKFDLVFSCGLVEHFSDLSKLIKIHLELASEKGRIFIEVPNLKGIYGGFLWIIDRHIYNLHNTEIMNLKYINKVLKKFNVSLFEVAYGGNFGVWLENEKTRNNFTKIFHKLMHLISYMGYRFLNKNSKLFSPYIVINISK